MEKINARKFVQRLLNLSSTSQDIRDCENVLTQNLNIVQVWNPCLGVIHWLNATRLTAQEPAPHGKFSQTSRRNACQMEQQRPMREYYNKFITTLISASTE
jgi:hypothetical protein